MELAGQRLALPVVGERVGAERRPQADCPRTPAAANTSTTSYSSESARSARAASRRPTYRPPVACGHDRRGTRVFIARLAGAAVFDPNGDQVGQVRDVVVALRAAPRRRRGCSAWSSRCRCAGASSCPMTRVTTIDAGAGHHHRPGQHAPLRAARRRDARARRAARPHGRACSRPASRSPSSGRRHRAGAHRATGRSARSSCARAGSGLRRRGETLIVDWDDGHRALPSPSRPGRRQPARHLREAATPPTSPTCCTSCPPSAASRSPRRWTTSSSPTSSRSCPRTTRSRSSAALEERARRRRPRGDGPRRRRRPALRAAAGRRPRSCSS